MGAELDPNRVRTATPKFILGRKNGKMDTKWASKWSKNGADVVPRNDGRPKSNKNVTKCYFAVARAPLLGYGGSQVGAKFD